MTIKIFCDIADLNQIKKNLVKNSQGFYHKSKFDEKAGAKNYKTIQNKF